MDLKSYSKINLFLDVNKKLSNGLHDIQSLFCLVDLFDTISIKKKNIENRKKIIIKGPFAKHVKKKNNSVQKILSILRQYKLISNFYDICIFKKIPVFSGLGGGTSNAATILKFLIKKKIKRKIFEKIVKYTGSDLRLFFHKRGYQADLKTLVDLTQKYDLYFLIIFPKINCSTKVIYSMVKKYSAKAKYKKKDLQTKKKFYKIVKNSKNDLQLIVEKKYPLIKKILKDLEKMHGCHFSRMTGSGSACFGLFNDEQCSKAALKVMRKKYPKFWFSIAKTI